MSQLKLRRKRIQLFSTLNPYPHWAGSEKYWFDFVTDDAVASRFRFGVELADSPATRKAGERLSEAGHDPRFYKHFNTHFLRRNLQRVSDSVFGRSVRTLPWYDRIKAVRPDLVWFNAAALADLGSLSYAVRICRNLEIPYWIVLQHAYEDFFFTSEAELESVSTIVSSARRFVHIADRNRVALERALGFTLSNAFKSVNAVGSRFLAAAEAVTQSPPSSEGTARFISVGRFSPQDKAQHLILESLASESWRSRDWLLRFVGIDGFGERYLSGLASTLGLPSEKIRFIPFNENVVEFFGESDVMLMPSRAEGTPFAAIEALSCGRPVVGTPVGGIPELVLEGRTGWLAKGVESVDIASALERCWADRGRWAEFGANGRDLVLNSNNQAISHPHLAAALGEDTGL